MNVVTLEDMADTKKKILIIGGHGKVALLATPELVRRGMDVTSLIRNPDQEPDIEASGSTPLVRDLTSLGVDDWAEVLRGHDVVIWTAGSGGENGAASTYAIDRDGALASIDGVKKLVEEGERAPRYLMVSYIGSVIHEVGPEDPFYAYADSKKTVDEHLVASGLEYLILAPAELTLEPSRGGEIIPNDPAAVDGRKTSRELVAQVLVEMSAREQLPEEKFLAFVDGDTPAAEF